jgi:hypothetical protein
LLGCFVSRQAPMSARLDDAPDNCERSQCLHQASSGREAVPECKLHGGLLSGLQHAVNDRDCACRGSHPRRLPGRSQYALLTPQNLARVPTLTICLLVTFPSCRCESFGPEGRSPSGPPPFPRDSTLSRHSTEATLAFVQARGRTRWRVNGEPYPSGSARQQDKSRRSTWFAASRLRRRRQVRHRRSARADKRRSTETPARRSKTRAGRARHTAPNPGTSWRGALGGDGRPEERSEGERTGPEHPVNPRGGPRTDARAGCRRRARPAAEDACMAAMKGGEHGQELRIRRPGGPARLRPSAASRYPTAREGRRLGGATVPGVEAQKARSRGLYAEDHPPKEGGGLCPEYGSSRAK